MFLFIMFVVGLNELDVEGEWLVQRQVMWKVPQPVLDKAMNIRVEKEEASPRIKKRTNWDITTQSTDHSRGEVRERGGGGGGQ